MNFEETKQLISKGESKTLEFKKSVASLDAAGKTLSGFLNQPEGGTVLIGINNRGELVGQDASDSVLKKLASFLNRFDPPGRIDINYISTPSNHKKIIALQAASFAHERPYSYDGKYYERVESTTQKLSHDHVRALFLESHDATKIWGEQTSNIYTIDDLDIDEIKKTVQQGVAVNRIESKALTESIEAILHRFKLIAENQLTHSAIVLFGKDVASFFPQCKIMMARFRGNDKYGEFIDNQRFEGNAFQILRVAENFVRKHLFIASRYQNDSFERIDEPTLPQAAIREALINAICHRNYRDRGTSIALAIYDEHFEIWNSGKLPPNWTLKKLTEKHVSDPRNELIAKIFYARKFIEGWGTGIEKILKECSQASLPKPRYSEYSNGVAITFNYREPLIIRPSETNKIPLTDRQKEILNTLKTYKNLAVRDILPQLKSAVSDRTLRRDLSYLKQKNLVDSTGHGRNLIWHLTKEGYRNTLKK